MYRAMRLRCLLNPPLLCKPASLVTSATGSGGVLVGGFSAPGGSALVRRLGAPPRPSSEGRRLCRFYCSKGGVGSAEAAVGSGGGSGGSGSIRSEQEHARLGERDQQEWLSGERFLTGCKRRESPFLTKRERFRNEFLRRVVPWEKGSLSWRNFPYYVDENAKQLLTECVASHLRHNDVTLEYGSRLQSSGGRILLQSLPGTELYRERLVRALARELCVPLLVLDSSVLAPYAFGEDCSETEEDDDHVESEDECSESEVEEEGDQDLTSSNEAKSGESDDDDTIKSMEDLKKLVPCTLEEFAKRVVGAQESSSAAESSGAAESPEEEKKPLQKGDRVKYVGASVLVEADHRIILGKIPTQEGATNAYTFISGRTLSNGQRGEVYEINGDQVAVIFDPPEEKLADGEKDEDNKEQHARPGVYWVDTQDIVHDHDTQAEDWHIAIEALCEALPSIQPAIIYFPDSSQWLSRAVPRSNRKVFVEKVEEMFDQLTGPLVLICGQNILEPAPKDNSDKEPKTLVFHNLSRLSPLSSSLKRLVGGLRGRKPSRPTDIPKLFRNRFFIPLPKDDEQLRVFNNQIAEDRKIIISRHNLVELRKVLEEHELSCEDLLHVKSEGIILTKQRKSSWIHIMIPMLYFYLKSWLPMLLICCWIMSKFGVNNLQPKVCWSSC